MRPYPNLAAHRPSVGTSAAKRSTSDPRRQTLGSYSQSGQQASQAPSAAVATAPQRRGPQDGLVFGKYLILRLLAKGGASEVYEAIHLGLKKHVALKVLRAEFAGSSYSPQEFLREGENAARIRHPHIVDVTDLGVVDQVPYLVMELLQGQDLATLFADRGPMQVDELVDIMLPVAAAVAAGHHQGVVHGDLKPANIFLHQEGRRVMPKLLDFGLSRRMHERRHPSGSQLFGTPHYMAPEQARGVAPADARTDQYALGVVLYEGVTGRLPHDHEDISELLRRTAEEPYPKASELVALPPEFEEVMERALCRDRATRFNSVAELATALCAFASPAVAAFWNNELTSDGPETMSPNLQARHSTSRSHGLPPPPPMGSVSHPSLHPSFSPTRRAAAIMSPSAPHDSPVQRNDSASRPMRNRWLWIGGAATATLAVTLLSLRSPSGSGGAENSATAASSASAVQMATASPSRAEQNAVQGANEQAVKPAVAARPTLQPTVADATPSLVARPQPEGDSPAATPDASASVTPEAEKQKAETDRSAKVPVRVVRKAPAARKPRPRKQVPSLADLNNVSKKAEAPLAAAPGQPKIQAIEDKEPSIQMLGVE